MSSLLLRIDDLSYITESLWAEDGNLFINQSHELGIASLWTPYAGYLFLYPTVVGLLARPIPLAIIPYVFFAAWLSAFAIAVFTVKMRSESTGLSHFATTFLACAIALQPSHGESLFNLNNANYMLGIALAFHICIPKNEPISFRTVLFLLVTSLSGPLSVAMIAVLALQLIVLRDFSSRMATYIVVTICGVVQSVFLISSKRMNPSSIDVSLAQWSDATSSFLLFGEINRLSSAAALILWITTLFLLSKRLIQMRRFSDRALWLSPLFAILVAPLLFFAGAWSARGWLTILSPIDMCSRFFLIPYSLIFFAALACTREHRAAQTIVISMISIICGAGFLTQDRADRASSTGLLSHENLQWTAFTKFRATKADVVIPVNPSWPIYPPFWKVQFSEADNRERPSITTPIVLTPQQSPSLPRAVHFGGIANTSEASSDQVLYFEIEGYCANRRYLALEIDVWRARMGWAELYWGKQGSLDASRSLKRFYPAGDVVMQFAFRRTVTDDLIRFNPTEGVTDSALVRQMRTWESVLDGTGMTFGEPTEPGGNMKIKAIRMYCLE